MPMDIVTRLESNFTPGQARALAFEVETILRQQVKASDFSELKEIVRDLAEVQKDLAEAQKRTEIKVEELVDAQKRTETKVGELADAQMRTEAKVEELAEAQRRTEGKVEELAGAQVRTEEELRQLARAQKNTQQEVGGMANTLGYMLENEAYRHLPNVLADKYKIRTSSKVIRQQVGNEEINLLAEGTRNRKPVLIVGESKTRLSAKDLTQLRKKIKEVERHYPPAASREIVPVMIVHFARDKELKRAEQEGVIVIQSFEW
ncbi:MAG: hypothetical protein ACRD82_00090 [Blastocatellia bacterium]